MLSVAVQRYLKGRTAVEIRESIETGIRDGRLEPGEQLPPIRQLAGRLRVSPATVASAYRALRTRGLLVTDGRRGTAVSARPPVASRLQPAPPPGVLDLSSGNPDPALLPDLAPALTEIDPSPVLYGEALAEPTLLRLARERFRVAGIDADSVSVVGGALDGIERVLLAHLRPGDRVAVEDPGFTGVLDLLPALGLQPVPVAVDDEGPRPDAFAASLRQVHAVVVTPRAQNPYGAALSEGRALELRRLLRRHPDLLLIEDDHAGAVAGAPASTLTDSGVRRWAAVHSVAKSLGPDLRVAVMASDATTLARVEGRQLLGIRWVSHLLQRLVVALWSDPGVERRLVSAERAYSDRRRGLLAELAERGIEAHGRSGLNVWVPVPEESGVVQALLESGFAVAAGQRFRLRTPPAVRVSVGRLGDGDAARLAEALAHALAPARRSRLA